MQGIPVAKVNAVPKVNAIDNIDALSAPLSKNIFASHTKSEEYSFAKLLARAQGKKIDAQVSDAFSGAGLLARGKSRSLSSHGGKSADRGVSDAAHTGNVGRSSARHAKADMLSGVYTLHENKRAFSDPVREDAVKFRRNDGADTVKESKTDGAKDSAKKETIDAVKDAAKKQQDDTSSDINQKKSLKSAENESGGRPTDAEALDAAEPSDTDDGARAALLQDFAYLVDGSRNPETVNAGSAQNVESGAGDFFAEGAATPEDTATFQMGALPVYAEKTSEGGTESGEFSDEAFSAESVFAFETKDETAAAKRERIFDTDGRIIVTDLRTEISESVSEAKPESEKLIKLDASDGASSEMTMFVPESTLQNVSPSNVQSAPTASSNFQAMLANQIRQNASDFVRAGSIVLRDNNAGTINLVLRPESLGNVKISLQLSDKVVSGQITVHSEEAYNAFKESADALKNAFAQSGFEAGGFTVAYSSAGTGGSFSGSGSGGGFADAQHAGRYESAFVSEVSVASGGSYIGSEHTVNVVV